MRPLIAICRIEIPQVAHGSVAIANVPCRGRNDNSLGRARFAGYHQIVSAQIETLQRHRHQREEGAVVSAQRLQERASHRVPSNFGRHAIRLVEQGEQLGVGHQLQQGLENFFASAPGDQPIVDEGDAKG